MLEQPSKYVVMKRTDWEAMDLPVEIRFDIDTHALDDAVVIRRQDVFSAPAFDAYANLIMATIEGLQAMTKDINVMDEGSMAEVIGSLQQTAQYFSQQAAYAWDTVRKLPD